ncbi:hypothetical protein [Salinibacter ruber]|uniref:hypothetical protein n=1 Tax=Salinibacter ruber TaxID=146919 RepID=UPI000A5F90A9|nr:hypothetical protein [Salinibacter ruber]MCS3682791.1 hypothetical protein [Salinibacter ruber]
MGKYILLVTLALGLSTTILANQGMRTDLETRESQADRQEIILARQIAQSAFEMGVSELRRDFQNWRVERSQIAHRGGTFDLTATGPSGGPVSLTAVGNFGDARYKVTGIAKEEEQVSGLFNGITAAGSVDFDVSGPGCSGGPCVSGIDAAGNENRRGISIPNSGTPGQDEDDVCSTFGDKVNGQGTGCDVNSRTQGLDEWIGSEMDKLRSQIEKKVNQESYDVTVCTRNGSGNGNRNGNGNGNRNGNGNSGESPNTCRMNGNSTDSGILYVKGDFRFNGQAQWNGPVYVVEGGSVRINGGGGTAQVNGSLLMEENTELDMNGGNRVQYNSEKIRDYFGSMGSLSALSVRITNRSGRIVR